MSVAADDSATSSQLAAVATTVRAVTAQAERGDAVGAARRFVEEVALGPGGWELLPEPLCATMVDSAPAFVAEQKDPMWAGVELTALADIACPVLLTQGDASPPWFAPIVAKLADAIEDAEVHTYEGAGHAPHLTHPSDYLAAVTGFLSRAPERAELK